MNINAPIDENYYRNFPTLPFPESYSGEPIKNVIEQAWAICKRLTNNCLDLTTFTDEVLEHGTLDCNSHSGTLLINPRYFPITSIDAIKYRDMNGILHDIDVRKAWQTQYGINVCGSPFFNGEKGQVLISYKAGYATIPEDLKMCCAMVTSRILSGAYFPANGGVGEGSLLPAWLPNEVQNILNRYTRFK